MGDFDGDGFLDLFFTGSVSNGKKPEAGPCGVLYRNRGDGTFEDVTARSGIRSCGWTMGASWVDLEGSGRLDLVVTGVGRTTLWKNLGDGTFREEGAARGLVAPGYAVGPRGGRRERGRARRPLRRRLPRHGLREGTVSFRSFEVRVPEDYAGQEAKLARPGRGRAFHTSARRRPASLNAGGRGLGGGLLRLRRRRQARPLRRERPHDERPLPQQGRRHVRGRDGRDRAPAARDQKDRPRRHGVAIGDVDGDGRPDILVTNFAGEPNTLYRNVEGVLFDDATESSGVERASLPYVQWGTDFVDFDDDGRPDLVTVSGHLVPRSPPHVSRSSSGRAASASTARGDRSYKQPPLVWRNAGAGAWRTSTAVDRATGRPCACRPAGSRSATWTATGGSTSRSQRSRAASAS